MDWFKDTQVIHIDITSYCNAACGTCARFVPESNDLHPLLDLNHFDVELFDRLVTYDLRDSNVNTIYFNGNYGDCSMHPELLTLVEICKKAGLVVELSTNGSPRTTKFWKELAGLLGPLDNVAFCIDGTSQETNELYRRKTVYNKILQNIKAFNDNGGSSIWTMTAFNHNINEIEQASNIAKDLGCSCFHARRSHEDHIRFPTYEVRTDLVEPKHIFKKYFKELDMLDIFPSEKQKQSKCRFYNKAKIQIDPFGAVWPCCYISQFSYGIDPIFDDPFNTTPDKVFDSGKLKEDLTLYKYTLEEILKSDFFSKFIPEKVMEESLNVCQRDCGLG